MSAKNSETALGGSSAKSAVSLKEDGAISSAIQRVNNLTNRLSLSQEHLQNTLQRLGMWNPSPTAEGVGQDSPAGEIYELSSAMDRLEGYLEEFENSRTCLDNL